MEPSLESLVFIDWNKNQVEEEFEYDAPAEEVNLISVNKYPSIKRFLPGLDRNADGLERSLPGLVTFAGTETLLAERNRRDLPENLKNLIGLKEPIIVQ